MIDLLTLFPSGLDLVAAVPALVLDDPRVAPRRLWQGALIAFVLLLILRQLLTIRRSPAPATAQPEAASASNNTAPTEEERKDA